MSRPMITGIPTMSSSPAGSPQDGDPGAHTGGVGFLQLFMEASTRIERTASRDTMEGASPDSAAADDRRQQ